MSRSRQRPLRSRSIYVLAEALARDLRTQLEAWERPNAGEIKAQVYRRHGNEAALGVHDTVIMGQGKRACTTESVAGY